MLGVAAVLGVALSGQDTDERDVYYTKNATVQSHIGGYATVGYANEADADKGLHPVRVTVRVAGGRFDKDLRVYSGSTVIFDNGNIGGMLYLRNGSTAIVNGGTIGNRSDPYTVSSVDVYEDSTVTLGGGHFGNDIRASDNSMINLTGGTFNGLLRDANIYLADRSTLNIFGTGLRKALTNVTSDAESEAGTYRQYKLSGTLADGSSLSGEVCVCRAGQPRPGEPTGTGRRPAVPAEPAGRPDDVLDALYDFQDSDACTGICRLP